MNISEEILISHIKQTLLFSWYDYTLLGTLLSLSLGIGVFFGCFGSKQKTHNEYLLGSRKLGVIPVSISLIASHTSGISLIATPSEIYRNGATYFWVVLTLLWIGVVASNVFLPVFHKLQVTTSYEYLEMRFDARTRNYASFLFMLSSIIFLPLVIYIPALSISTASGINVHIISSVLCGICIIYTTLGGVRAVIWTDTVQFVLTLCSVLTIFVYGVNSVDGFGNILNKAIEGGRLDMLNFNLDPTERDGFFQVVIGFGFLMCSLTATHQSSVQKYLTLPTLSKAKIVVFISSIGYGIVDLFCGFTGLIMFAKYHDCDPYDAGLVKAKDGMIQFYVMDVASHVPGLVGLFTAGVCSSALSTLSANLNCIGGAFYDDIMCRIFKQPSNTKTGSGIIKIIVLLMGIVCTLLIFVVEKLGKMFQLLQNLMAVTTGPSLALFTMGVLMPNIEETGAFYGALMSSSIHIVIIIMRSYYQAYGYLTEQEKPFSNDACLSKYNISMEFNSVENNLSNEPTFTPFYLFRISMYYYTVLIFGLTIIFASVISIFNKKKRSPKRLFSPVIHFMLPEDEDDIAQTYHFANLKI